MSIDSRQFRVFSYQARLIGIMDLQTIFQDFVFSFWLKIATAAVAAAKLLQSCPTLQPHRQQPTRLVCLWDSPGKNTGVGCHCLLQCTKVKSESEVTQSCRFLATPWTAAYQTPPSMLFSRQEYWSGVPLPSPN